MVAGARCLELDLVEVFDVCHSSHGTPAVLRSSYGFGVYDGVAARSRDFRFQIASRSHRGRGLASSPFERVPETAAQRVPYLVMEQEVDGQRGPLQEPRLKVRGHPGLPRQHGLKPQRRSVARHRLAERLALLVSGLHGVAERDALRAPGVTARPNKANRP